MRSQPNEELSASEILQRIREGMEPREIPPAGNSPRIPTFDWSQLDRSIDHASANSLIGAIPPAMVHHGKPVRWLARLTAQAVRYLSKFLTVPQSQFNSALLDSVRGLRERTFQLERALESTTSAIGQRVCENQRRLEELAGIGGRLDGRLRSLESGQNRFENQRNEIEARLGVLESASAGQQADLHKVTRALDAHGELYTASRQKFEKSFHEVKGSVKRVQDTMTELAVSTTLAICPEYLSKRTGGVESALDEATRTLRSVAEVLAEGERRMSELYPEFEDTFRGSRDEVKAKLAPYLSRFQTAGIGAISLPALDLGCGRGEWLELLRDNGFQAVGLDSHPAMIAGCRMLGLNVHQADALEFLGQQSPETFSAVTCFHMLEHVRFDQVLLILDKAFRCMASGGLLILETPDPENLSVGSCSFYLDPTHHRPIPAWLLKFGVEKSGFADAEVIRLNPREPLRSGTGQPGKDSRDETLDYAVIARKPATHSEQAES